MAKLVLWKQLDIGGKTGVRGSAPYAISYMHVCGDFIYGRFHSVCTVLEQEPFLSGKRVHGSTVVCMQE